MEPKIRTALSAPFADDLVKRRRGSFGREISYVEGNAIVQRLLDCFDGDFSFEIVEHHELATGEILVRGRLTVLGRITKEAFGRGMPAISKETGEVLSAADAYKAAATDALKKAATLLGVALNLYADDPVEQSEEKPARFATKPTPASRASSKQVSAIWSLGRRLGLDANAIRSRCAAEYGGFPETIDRVSASAFITALSDEIDSKRGAA